MLTGDDGVRIMKIVTMVNGKDVLWSNYTLRFPHIRKYFQSCHAAVEKLFLVDRENDLYRYLRKMMGVLETE